MGTLGLEALAFYARTNPLRPGGLATQTSAFLGLVNFTFTENELLHHQRERDTLELLVVGPAVVWGGRLVGKNHAYRLRY